jgi:hypothetical protein
MLLNKFADNKVLMSTKLLLLSMHSVKNLKFHKGTLNGRRRLTKFMWTYMDLRMRYELKYLAEPYFSSFMKYIHVHRNSLRFKTH